MKTCKICGGNAYRDADTLCAHEYVEAPEPDLVQRADRHTLVTGVPGMRSEESWIAAGPKGETWPHERECWAEHPTRDGAIAAFKERWLWGHALAALFRWLLGSGPSDLARAIDEEIDRAVLGNTLASVACVMAHDAQVEFTEAPRAVTGAESAALASGMLTRAEWCASTDRALVIAAGETSQFRDPRTGEWHTVTGPCRVRWGADGMEVERG